MADKPKKCAAKKTPSAFRPKKHRAIIQTRFLPTKNLPSIKKRLTKPSVKSRQIKPSSSQRRGSERDSRSLKKKLRAPLRISVKNWLKSVLAIRTKNRLKPFPLNLRAKTR